MAYIERRKYKTKTSYLVMVRRKGFKTMVKTFDTRTDAKKWARAVERKLDMGDSALVSFLSPIRSIYYQVFWSLLIIFDKSG